ncbi:MAG: hypothetical protein GF335_04620 [Candidatus Moranbacteria bacterium]|nr:hypothetical protein [Candidatus Moranbacteria bacterium]
MYKFEKKPFNATDEIDNSALKKQQRYEKIADLEATEGFHRLSNRQQKMIKLSLYMQERFERLPYLDNSFYACYCHKAVDAIETEKIEEGDVFPEDFYEASYKKISSLDDAENHILSIEFPVVVHIARGPGPVEGSINKGRDHSFIVFGKNSSGDIIVWEKEGTRYPFRVTTLKEVYKDYTANYFWGVRELKDRTSK